MRLIVVCLFIMLSNSCRSTVISSQMNTEYMKNKKITKLLTVLNDFPMNSWDRAKCSPLPDAFRISIGRQNVSVLENGSLIINDKFIESNDQQEQVAKLYVKLLEHYCHGSIEEAMIDKVIEVHSEIINRDGIEKNKE